METLKSLSLKSGAEQDFCLRLTLVNPVLEALTNAIRQGKRTRKLKHYKGSGIDISTNDMIKGYYQKNSRRRWYKINTEENNSFAFIYKKKQMKMRKEKDPIYNSNNKDKISRNKLEKFQDKNENFKYPIGIQRRIFHVLG